MLLNNIHIEKHHLLKGSLHPCMLDAPAVNMSTVFPALLAEVGRQGYSVSERVQGKADVRLAGSEHSLIMTSELVHTGRAPSTMPYGLQLLVHAAAWKNEIRNCHIHHKLLDLSPTQVDSKIDVQEKIVQAT